MKKLFCLLALSLPVLIPSMILAMPGVYPTGTTFYKPDKCWSGYTILTYSAPSVLIDMNGNVVKKWPINVAPPIPCKILPGGYIMTSRRGAGRGINSVIQMDWDDKIVWQFDKFEQVQGFGPPSGAGPKRGRPGGSPLGAKVWTAGVHHDFQREGNPVGYYVPGMEPMVDKGKTLILAYTASKNPRINSNVLLDDVIYEVTWDGKVVWKWVASEHVDEMGFSELEFKAMQRNRAPRVDWLHVNCASYLGPNKWFDRGDERFHPDNIIFDSKTANILAIIEKKTSKIVWLVGPRYDSSPQLKKLGWILGPHHTHMIPKGLPGAGNILVYDNGGSAGYGDPDPVNRFRYFRDYSRVIEFNPVTLEKEWEYSPVTLGMFVPGDGMREYSAYISSAQRLPNGNTLITEGADGRIIEVTPALEVVWEYVSPYYRIHPSRPGTPKHKVPGQDVYRAYRVPYDYIPQIKKPEEIPVIPPRNKNFRVEGSGDNFKIKIIR